MRPMKANVAAASAGGHRRVPRPDARQCGVTDAQVEELHIRQRPDVGMLGGVAALDLGHVDAVQRRVEGQHPQAVDGTAEQLLHRLRARRAVPGGGRELLGLTADLSQSPRETSPAGLAFERINRRLPCLGFIVRHPGEPGVRAVLSHVRSSRGHAPMTRQSRDPARCGARRTGTSSSCWSAAIAHPEFARDALRS